MRRTKRSRAAAFTLLEVVIVIVIIAVVLSIALPVFVQARAKARQAACGANLRQLGNALQAYSLDYDESVPNGLAPRGLFARQTRLNVGWAGRIYPYVKSAGVFACPADDDSADGKSAVPISYGLNRNLSYDAHAASLSAPASTVLLFEVTNSTARITDPSEGLNDSQSPQQLSAVGNGIRLIGWPKWWGKGAYSLALYATGYLDNYGGDRTGYPDGRNDWYEGPNGRHSRGANYLAADGHAVWLIGDRVSAGYSAANSTNPQSESGCRSDESRQNNAPCAEGTGVSKHRLTFSVR